MTRTDTLRRRLGGTVVRALAPALALVTLTIAAPRGSAAGGDAGREPAFVSADQGVEEKLVRLSDSPRARRLDGAPLRPLGPSGHQAYFRTPWG